MTLSRAWEGGSFRGRREELLDIEPVNLTLTLDDPG